MAAIDRQGNILYRTKRDTPKSDRADEIVRTIVEEANECREAIKPEGKVEAIAAAVPATVSVERGILMKSPNVPCLDGFRMVAALENELNIKAVIENDANAAAVGENWLGASKGCRNSIMVTLGTGVGGGIIINDMVLRGIDGTAGEIGHVVVEQGDRFAAVCRCGHRGCLETVVSARTVTTMLAPLLGAPPTVAEVVARARDGYAPASRILADTGHHVGVALAGLCTMLTPRRIVVGGELAQAGELLLEPLHAALAAAALPGTTRTAEVVVAELAEHAPVLGALALALDRCSA